MSNSHWALLEQIQQELKDVSDLPPTIMLAIANRLEEAIAVSTRLPLESLAKQLEELFNTLFGLAPIDAMEAIRGSASQKSPENAAFMLGQVSFAQLLASQAAERRVDDAFLQSLAARRFKPYLNALFQNARTGKELSVEVNQSVETVSRTLKELRSQGITDFRREGTAFYNFLTPAARAVLDDMSSDGEEKSSANGYEGIAAISNQIVSAAGYVVTDLSDTYRFAVEFSNSVWVANNSTVEEFGLVANQPFPTGITYNAATDMSNISGGHPTNYVARNNITPKKINNNQKPRIRVRKHISTYKTPKLLDGIKDGLPGYLKERPVLFVTGAIKQAA